MRLDAEFIQGTKENADVFPDTWQCIATDYSARSLTESSDKLPALAGIARRFHELSGDQYLAGLWKKSILDDLLWAHQSIDIYRTYAQRQTSDSTTAFIVTPPGRPAQYRAPSWSWAAVDGAVRWPLAEKNRTGKYYAKALELECKVMHKSLDVFGEVVDGYVTLKGPLWKIDSNIASQLLYPDKEIYSYASKSDFWWMFGAKMDTESDQVINQSEAPNLFLLLIKDGGALVLHLDKKESRERDESLYKRVGVVIDTTGSSFRYWDETHRSACTETICRIY